MWSFFKKNYRIIVILIFIPFLVIGILKICLKYLPGETIGTADGWLGFLGGYFGILGALFSVWWQLNEINKNERRKEKEEYRNFLKYIKILVENNLAEYNSKKDNTLRLVCTFHCDFLSHDEILHISKLEKNIYLQYFDKIIKNNHLIIVELFDILLETENIIKETFFHLKEKSVVLKEINNLIEKFARAENLNLIEKLKDTENENLEDLIILNNFRSFSRKVNNPNSHSLLYFEKKEFFLENWKDFIKRPNFILGYETHYDQLVFRGYTAKDKLKLKKIEMPGTDNMPLFWFYYSQMLILVSIPPFFEKIKPEYSDLYPKISKLYYLDKKREELLKKYEKKLNEVSNFIDENFNNFFNQNILKDH